MIAVRVLQVGNDASVAYCGLQFALWGADVAVLPSGDGEDPFTDRYLGANKRLIGQAVQGVGADVVLCACSTAELAEIGVDTDTAIVARITAFAEDGVLHGTPATALLLEAASGYLGINGSPDREPLRAPGNLVSYVAGASAFGATLAALHKRLTTGGMERVVTSGLDVLASITPFLRSQVTGRADKRHGGPATGVRLYPVGDGHVSLKLIDNAMFAMTLDLLGVDANAVPVHLATPGARREDPVALGAFLEAHSRDLSAESFFTGMRVGTTTIGKGSPR